MFDIILALLYTIIALPLIIVFYILGFLALPFIVFILILNGMK
jgi:hypothetical protein